ncbi:MAG: DUF1573 domain-containing protein [Bacteroidales bacterium]
MQKTVFTIILSITIGIFGINAQDNTIGFEKKMHDFGRVKEDGGKIRYTFKFINKGKQPIIIKNVESSCGCTTPDWSKTPVLPGKEGFVSAEYDPIDRPGAFTKQITVYNNITSQPVILEIKGDVIPKKKEVSDIYKYKIGDLRLKSNHIAFARLLNTQTESQTVDIFNDSDKPLSLTANPKSLKEHLSLSTNPKVIPAKQAGTLTVTYNASKAPDWDYQVDRIALLINNQEVMGYSLSVSASVVEDFSKMTPAQLANAPTMDFETKEFDMGKLKQGESVSHEFKFTNHGKSDLIIRKTQSSCGCTAVESKNVIKPGESSSIKVTFNTAGKTGGQNKSVSIICNVPGKNQDGADKNRITLRITADVLDPNAKTSQK